MVELFVYAIDDRTLKEHIEIKKILLKRYMDGTLDEALLGAEKYREILDSYRRMMRSKWQEQEQEQEQTQEKEPELS